MSLALAAAGPSAYWYLSRATGIVALLLLTASMLLGVLNAERFSITPHMPRFAIDKVHRDVSLLVLALLVVHIATSVLDSFAHIGVLDAVVPFHGAYRPLWLGLGALSFDVLIAVALTSMLRRRLGYRAWRSVHWLAYASWPVAVFHGLGAGSDVKQTWMLALTGACVLAVVLAAGLRVVRSRPERLGLRPLFFVLLTGVPVLLAAFTLTGPLAPHWAQRAGTPATLLASKTPVRVVSAPVRAQPAGQAGDTIQLPFNAQLQGTAKQTRVPGGSLVDLALTVTGDIRGSMRVRMAGSPISGGGLSMMGSQVQLTAAGLTSVLQGKIISLEGNQFVASVKNRSGTSVVLHATVNIDNTNDTVQGTMSGTTAGAVSG